MLNLGRTPWHMTWEAYDRSAPAVSSTGRACHTARNLPVEPSWSCRRRAPRHGCQPCLRGSRPSSRVPSALSLSASRFRDTHSTRTVQPTGTCRAPATVAARVVWVRVADGTTTALHPGPGKEGPARVPQGTAGLSPSPGLSSYGWKAAPFESRTAQPLPLSNGQRPGNCRWSRRPAQRRPPPRYAAASRRRPPRRAAINRRLKTNK